MEWTNEKPKEVGIYFRSNPSLQKNITQQTVFNVDGKLMTHHPPNDASRLIMVEDLPNSFIWLKIPYPPHYKKSYHEKPNTK